VRGKGAFHNDELNAFKCRGDACAALGGVNEASVLEFQSSEPQMHSENTLMRKGAMVFTAHVTGRGLRAPLKRCPANGSLVSGPRNHDELRRSQR
jgi:hypothetical protein